MSFLKVILLLVCVLAIYMETVSADITGTFTDSRGANCKYKVGHFDKKQRQLKVDCKILKKPKETYSCYYCGDPHCDWYNKSANNAAKYFTNLTSRLAVAPSGACHPATISTSGKCSEIVFNAGKCSARIITRGERIVFREMDITEY